MENTSFFTDHLATWLGNDIVLLALGLLYSYTQTTRPGRVVSDLVEEIKENSESTEANMLKELIKSS